MCEMQKGVLALSCAPGQQEGGASPQLRPWTTMQKGAPALSCAPGQQDFPLPFFMPF